MSITLYLDTITHLKKFKKLAERKFCAEGIQAGITGAAPFVFGASCGARRCLMETLQTWRGVRLLKWGRWHATLRYFFFQINSLNYDILAKLA